MTKKGKTISYYNNKYGGLSRRKTQQAAQTAAQIAAEEERERYTQARLDMSTLTRELITKNDEVKPSWLIENGVENLKSMKYQVILGTYSSFNTYRNMFWETILNGNAKTNTAKLISEWLMRDPINKGLIMNRLRRYYDPTLLKANSSVFSFYEYLINVGEMDIPSALSIIDELIQIVWPHWDNEVGSISFKKLADKTRTRKIKSFKDDLKGDSDLKSMTATALLSAYQTILYGEPYERAIVDGFWRKFKHIDGDLESAYIIEWVETSPRYENLPDGGFLPVYEFYDYLKKTKAMNKGEALPIINSLMPKLYSMGLKNIQKRKRER
jgi:hypothetical protein